MKLKEALEIVNVALVGYVDDSAGRHSDEAVALEQAWDLIRKHLPDPNESTQELINRLWDEAQRANDDDDFEKFDDLRTQVWTLLEEEHEDISEDDFYENFTMVKNHLDDNASFNGCMFETYGEEHDYVRKMARETNRVWTIVDGEYDTQYYIAGYHFVNRLGYIITEEDWPSDTSNVLIL